MVDDWGLLVREGHTSYRSLLLFEVLLTLRLSQCKVKRAADSAVQSSFARHKPKQLWNQKLVIMTYSTAVRTTLQYNSRKCTTSVWEWKLNTFRKSFALLFFLFFKPSKLSSNIVQMFEQKKKSIRMPAKWDWFSRM